MTRVRAELAQGGRPCDPRCVLIRRYDSQKRGRIGLVRARGVKRLGVALEAFSNRPVPAFDRRRRPGRRLVAVTVIAGVGRAELHGQIGTRNAEAVIVPLVDHHVGARRHVTRRAGERRVRRRMAVVRDRGIFVGGVTLQADAVSRRTKLGGVRLVTIAAGDAGSEHFALLERAVVVDLVQHLPVGTVEPAREQRDRMRVRERAPRHPLLGKFAAARVTQPAGLDLLAHERGRDVAARVARGRIDRPDDTVALVEPDQQTLARVIALAERPPALLRPGPADMPRPLSMTGLAAHADFREAGGKAVGCGVVILAHAGRMASRAHEVPVLVQPGPVQHVIVLDLLVRVEMKPALAALVLRPAVPGERQRLQAAVGKLDQILLQWLDAERVLDLKRHQPAVGPVGLDEKLPILAEEAGSHAVIVEGRIAEIAEHRFVVRMLHGKLVLRAVPELRLRPVTAGAGLAADEGGRRSARHVPG